MTIGKTKHFLYTSNIIIRYCHPHMPLFLIIIGLVVVIGIGAYLLKPDTSNAPSTTSESAVPAPATPETDGTTVEPEANDNESNSVPSEPGDEPGGTGVTTPLNDTTSATPTIYINGTHTVNTSYRVPNGASHTVAVTLTLEDDVVTASQITFGGDKVAISTGFQDKFLATYEAEVIGKKLASISLSRVGGASLTSNSFNDALAKVKATAAN